MHKKFLSALLSLALAASAVGMPQLSASETGGHAREYAQIGTAPVMEIEEIETEPQPSGALQHGARVTALMEALPQGTDPLAAEILAARGIVIIPGYGAMYAHRGRAVSPGDMIGLVFTPDGGIFDPIELLRTDPEHPIFSDAGYEVAAIEVDVSRLSDFEAMHMTIFVMSDGKVGISGTRMIWSASQTFAKDEEDAFLRAFEEMEGISLDEWMAQNEPSASDGNVCPDAAVAGISPLTPGASGIINDMVEVRLGVPGGNAFATFEHERRGFFVHATGIAEFTHFWSWFREGRNIVHYRLPDFPAHSWSGRFARSRYRRTDQPVGWDYLYTIHPTGWIELDIRNLTNLP